MKKDILFLLFLLSALTYCNLSFAQNSREKHIIIRNNSSQSFKVYVDNVFSGVVDGKGSLKISAVKGLHKVRVEGKGRMEERDVNLVGKTAYFTIAPPPDFSADVKKFVSLRSKVYVENKKNLSLEVYLKGKGAIGNLKAGEKKTVYLEPGKYKFSFKNSNRLIYKKSLSIKKGRKYSIIIE